MIRPTIDVCWGTNSTLNLFSSYFIYGDYFEGILRVVFKCDFPIKFFYVSVPIPNVLYSVSVVLKSSTFYSILLSSLFSEWSGFFRFTVRPTLLSFIIRLSMVFSLGVIRVLDRLFNFLFIPLPTNY